MLKSGIAAILLTLIISAPLGAWAEAAPASAKTVPLKVAFIITDPHGSTWNQSWNEAREQMVAVLHVPTITVGPVPGNNQVATQAVDLINQGYNVIVAEDFAYQPFLHGVAQQHPNVNFIVIGPNTQPPLPNVATVYGNLWQVRYVEGVLAGLMTKTNKLGFVTAHTIPSVVAGINGFELGALSVNPKARTYVVETGQWYDPAGGMQGGETLTARGADVIAEHEDDAGVLQAAERAHVWAMPSEADTSAEAPKTYLSGSINHWSPYLIAQLRAMETGTWKAGNYYGDLASGLVGLGPINQAVPASVVAKVKATIAGIDNGTIHVFKGPIYYNTGTVAVPAGETLSDPAKIYPKQNNFVRGIIGRIKS